MAQSTTLSSAGFSVPIILDPKLKTTTVQLTVASGTTAGSSLTFIQFTLDDPTTTPAPTISWAPLSSSVTSSGLDTSAGGGLIYTVLSPLGGLRLGSSGTVSGTITLKSLQSITG